MFCIAKDFIDDIMNTAASEIPPECKHEFRLRADGIVYYRGFSDRPDNSEPLEWARKFAGCTDIQYFNGEKWVSI
jgi:hypothetical protein